MSKELLSVENIYAAPPAFKESPKSVIGNSPFMVTHCNEIWDITKCLDFNPYKVSHSVLHRSEAIVFRGEWVQCTLPQCFRLFTPEEDGPWAVRFKADSKIRIVYKYKKSRGQDVNTLSIARRNFIAGQLADMGAEIPAHPKNGDILDVLKRYGRYVDDQITVDCTCS
jgi:hypothetical protein